MRHFKNPLIPYNVSIMVPPVFAPSGECDAMLTTSLVHFPGTTLTYINDRYLMTEPHPLFIQATGHMLFLNASLIAEF